LEIPRDRVDNRCRRRGENDLERRAVGIGDRELAMFFRRALAESRRVVPGDRRRFTRRTQGDRRRR